MPKQKVNCSQCGKEVIRWPINPVTKKPIKHFFCDTSCKGKWQIAQREALGFTKEWLIDQYIAQRKDANKIGREIGRDGHSVWNWLVGYGIQTRPRGGLTLPHSFQKGQKNPFEGRKHSQETKEKLRAIAKADGRVPYDPNVGSYMKGRKGEDTPGWKGGITPERNALYASQEWCDAVKKYGNEIKQFAKNVEKIITKK